MANYHIKLETFSANVRFYEADDDLAERCQDGNDLSEIWDECDDEMGGDYACELDAITPNDEGTVTVTDEDDEEIYSANLSDIPFKSNGDGNVCIDEGRYLAKVYHQENVLLEGDIEIDGDFEPERLYFATEPVLKRLGVLDEGPKADPRNLMYEGMEDSDYCGLDYIEDEGESENVYLLELVDDTEWEILAESEE